MKEVLRHIFEKKRAYATLPLFEWMRDERLDPRERLAFYPCMAHFILSFGDLNKFVLREERPADVYQEMVNAHTRAEERAEERTKKKDGKGVGPLFISLDPFLFLFTFI
jgi:hypothetical protein